MAYIKVKGHQQWYNCVKLICRNNQAKFYVASHHGLRVKSNVKFLDTAGLTARQTNTDYIIEYESKAKEAQKENITFNS